jgi:tryptophan-rich sensory protein
MPVIMIIYYLISIFIASMLVWNFIREKEDRQMMLLYLVVLIPFVLRILRIE